MIWCNKTKRQTERKDKQKNKFKAPWQRDKQKKILRFKANKIRRQTKRKSKLGFKQNDKKTNKEKKKKKKSKLGLKLCFLSLELTTPFMTLPFLVLRNLFQWIFLFWKLFLPSVLKFTFLHLVCILKQIHFFWLIFVCVRFVFERKRKSKWSFHFFFNLSFCEESISSW